MLETKRHLEQVIEEARVAGVIPQEDVKRLRLEVIHEHERLFQQRRPVEHESRQHVEKLCKVLRDGSTLPAVVVFRAGHQWVLLDGHHRMKAYRKAGWEKEIPVQVFSGTLDAAIGRSTRENHRDSLQMTNAEKMDSAWRMVCVTRLTIKAISRDTGASMRNIAYMRKAKEALLAEGKALADLSGMSWNVARTTARGEQTEQIDWDEQDEKESRELANELSKIFGKRLHRKHQIIAMALEAYDSRLPDTLRQLWDNERGAVESFDDGSDNPDF